MTDVAEFQRESYRIDEQIWDALALRSGERALFLGLANDGAWIRRAVEIGADVTVLGIGDAAAERIEQTGAAVMRGSATMIPATEGAYDVAVAMHYLHEIDPGFHAQVVSELARVGKRVAIVEPSPPADALGKRIAALYGRAKREAGQFEGYQPIDYWRKLLAIVKADVWQNLFTFTRVPPKHAVAETVSLILEAMAIEEMPKAYLDELRELAARPDAQLLPLSRIVLVGTAAGEALPQGSGEPFRPYAGPAPAANRPAAAAPVRAPAPPSPAAPPPQQPPPPPPSFGFASEEPPLAPAPQPARALSSPTSPPPPRNVPPPAAPPPERATAPPFGAPFALPDEGEEEPPFGGAGEGEKTGFGWSWEPPEEEPPPEG
ncbi:MAG: hypothetical protein JO083_11290 [Candidatus Eremiobacteraeota bacterium]|nr:hypothetical protein [Candidatus Eremiobacteraeota bacterium]